jgi:hypothetical protein
MKIVGGSALSRSLNETFRNLITEGNVKDTRGDTWSSKTVVRNETHPHFQKSKDLPKLNGVAHEENSHKVWMNHRTMEVHHGEMILHPDGKASPFSHSGNPQMFHSSHYFETEE